jgi:hypothetical protein
MRRGARRCNSCGQWLSVRDRLLNGITIGGLVSLVPVLALAAAFLNTQILYRYADVRATAIDCSPSKILVGVTNVGNRPAILQGASVVAVLDGVDDNLVHTLTLGDQKEMALLAPDKSVVLELKPTNPLPPPTYNKTCGYKVTLHTLTFEHRARPVEVSSCACS